MAEKIVFKLMRFNTFSEMIGVVDQAHLAHYLNWRGEKTDKNFLYFDVVEQRDSHRRKWGETTLFCSVPVIKEGDIKAGSICSSINPSLLSINDLTLYLAGVEGDANSRIISRTFKESADHYFHLVMALIKSWSINGGFTDTNYFDKTPVPVEEGPAPLWNEGPEVYIL